MNEKDGGRGSHLTAAHQQGQQAQEAPPGRTPFRTIITIIVVAESSRFCLPEETDFCFFLYIFSYIFHTKACWFKCQDFSLFVVIMR